VATYHRPALLDLLLASLKAIEVPKGCAVECRIVDNDKAGSARETAERWAAAGTLPGKLRYEIEPTQGISAARNHALDMGPADLIAYIDDDEVASPRWLAELVATLDRTGADAVFGPVVARFLEGTPGWMIRGGFYDKQVRREGSPLEWNETRTSNALVRGEWFFAKGLRYAPEYGRTGGEDTQLFARMEVDGARYAASALAIVSEEVHRDRMRVRWLLRTSWLRTLTYHRTLENHSKGRRLPLGLLSVLRVARATALCLASLPLLLVGRQEHFWRAMTRWAVACAGIHYWLRPGRARDYVAYGPK
jgi:succinoglycan biosynthesis protein ExoM